MLKRITRELAFWALVAAVAFVMGTRASEAQQAFTGKAWFETWDVPKILITALFGLAVWFTLQKVNSIDAKFKDFFEWKGETDTRLTVLETEHKLRTGRDCQPRRHAEVGGADGG